jgi:hypothetical protein
MRERELGPELVEKIISEGSKYDRGNEVSFSLNVEPEGYNVVTIDRSGRVTSVD